MYTWFACHAPFQKKLTIAFGAQGFIAAEIVFVFSLALNGLITPMVAYSIGGGAVALSFVSAFLMTRALSLPNAAMVARMEGLAAGDLVTAIPFTHHKDGIGRMAAALTISKDTALAKLRVEASLNDQMRQSDLQRGTQAAETAEHGAQMDIAIAALGAGIEHLSLGNLAYRIEQPMTGSADILRQDFNASLETLQQAMKSVGTNASVIRSGANELATAADELARRTEKQAANLEETAASLDAITGAVRQTAQGALHAREVVTTAKSDAETSGAVAEQAIHAINAIASSSRQIGQIIGVIDEIAFQTNLLALNAGVEAARAGDAGRGFAVVASEVRTLAQRSAEAAKEIKELVSNASMHVDQGVELVNQTGKSLGRIVSNVTEINAVVAQITSSAQEQATALQEVNTAVGQMDQMTQQNAAMVEESTAASHAMMKEAESLSHFLSRFQVGRTDVVDIRAAKSARRPPAAVARGTSNVAQGSARAKAAPAATTDNWEEF